LAKSRSLFGDPVEKIERLTQTITQDITTIKLEIEELERVVQRNNGNKHSSDHSVTVIHALNTSLLRTTKGLHDALNIRTQNMKAQEDRRRKIIGVRRPGPAPLNPARYFDLDVSDNGGEDAVIEMGPLMSLQTEDSLVVQRANAVRDIEVHIEKYMASSKNFLLL